MHFSLFTHSPPSSHSIKRLKNERFYMQFILIKNNLDAFVLEINFEMDGRISFESLLDICTYRFFFQIGERLVTE